ncbi:hypothetical protein PBLACG01_0021100 [Plasmodium sp.]|nr:hypothetical protein PBLACG01_0021100 [Plasmodium sp.]
MIAQYNENMSEKPKQCKEKSDMDIEKITLKIEYRFLESVVTNTALFARLVINKWKNTVEFTSKEVVNQIDILYNTSGCDEKKHFCFIEGEKYSLMKSFIDKSIENFVFDAKKRFS